MGSPRAPWLVLGMTALLLTVGCRSLSCNNPDAYSGAADQPRLRIPAGLDGPDTSQALEIPALQASPAPRGDAKSCLEEPPQMKEAGSISTPGPQATASEPERARGRNRRASPAH